MLSRLYALLFFVLFTVAASSESNEESAEPTVIPQFVSSSAASAFAPSATVPVVGIARDNTTFRIELWTPEDEDANPSSSEDDDDLDIIDHAQAICWYPLSAFYGLLPRILFYTTLVFALVMINFPWLVVGALASGMTYAGVVAIHAIIMTWSQRANGNLDFGAALGILSFSAAIVIPLLNWSKTIKNIGRGPGQAEDSAGRSIILYWSALIFMALLSQIIGLWIAGSDVEDLSNNIVVFSNTREVTCSPPRGLLDLNVGQNTRYQGVWMTKEFVEANECHNPCKDPTQIAITRSLEQLKPLAERAVRQWYYPTQNTSARQDWLGYTLIRAFLSAGTAVLCIIIVQGIITAAYGRRWPVQVRNITYLKLRPRQDRTGRLANAQSIAAQVAGFKLQSISWIASALSIVTIPLAIAITEYAMHEFDHAEENFTIDQWAPWVSTALVLFSALLFRFQDSLRKRTLGRYHGSKSIPIPKPPPTEDHGVRSEDGVRVSFHEPNSSGSGEVLLGGKATLEDEHENELRMMFTQPARFWRDRKASVVAFWRDPDFEAERNRGQWALGRTRTQIEREKSFLNRQHRV